MRVKVDILEYATENVLLIKCKDNKWRLVVFISKSLNEGERNYEIYNRKILVII